MKSLRKFFRFFFISVHIFFLSTSPALAFSYPMPVPAMNQILGNLGVNKSSLRNAIKDFNVYDKKKEPPQVSITFEPQNPVPGEKVTAIATPSYFMNSAEDLYFTWFLKPSGCPSEEDTDPNDWEKDNCDYNKDNEVTIEDYKIKAARTAANNNFEWDKKDTNDKTIYQTTSSVDKDGYGAVLGGDDQRGKNTYCYIHDTAYGSEYLIPRDKCNHLFPKAYYMDGDTVKVHVKDSDDKTKKEQYLLGEKNSSDLEIAEEAFWHTDPRDPDTADTGNGDEANLIGLGQTGFSWNYTHGDKVGVVVEGISVEPTQTYDASYKIMWALPYNNLCNPGYDGYSEGTTTNVSSSTQYFDNDSDGQIDLTRVTEETTTTVVNFNGDMITVDKTTVTVVTNYDTETGDVIGKPSATTTHPSPNPSTHNIGDKAIKSTDDINDCLYLNMIDPFEGGGRAEKMEVNLSYYPEVPMNDPAGVDGDEVLIKANVMNAQNTDYLTYEWQLYESNETNPDSWGSPIVKSELEEQGIYTGETRGLGLDTLKIKLSFEKPKKYLRAKVTVTENVSNGTKKEGRNDIIIPIQSISEKIQVFGTVVSDDLLLNLNTIERCTSGEDAAICPVGKNEIIGLKLNNKDSAGNSIFSDILWTIDGEPIRPGSYQTAQSSTQENIAFFPVLEDPGATYNVTLTATNQKTGEKLSLTKIFEITDPQISIIPENEDTCKPLLLGHYVDLDNTLWPDYSENTFLALTGYPIKLSAVTFGSSPVSSYSWTVDGQTAPLLSSISYENGYPENEIYVDEQGLLTVPPKPADESYQITVNTLYTQDNNTKKALNEYWDVPLTSFYEKILGDTVDITMVKFMPLNMQEEENADILASAWSAAPEYFVFLLRIVLTAFIMIAAARIVFMISPHYELRK